MGERVRKYKTPGVEVSLKLTEDAIFNEQVKLISDLRGVRELIQLFPEQEGDRSRLFIARIGSRAVKSVLEKLAQNPSIDYAEIVAPRYLVS